MTLPRFRLRTLMIAVAMAGVSLWVVVAFPVALYVYGTLAIPLIGACWRGHGATDRFSSAVGGGIIGGIINAFTAEACWIAFRFPLTTDDWLIIPFVQIVLLVVGFYLGMVVGLLVGIGLRLAHDL